MPIELWQVERMRDKVEELAGELKIRIFSPEGCIFQIWYNRRDEVALYGEVYWSESEGVERLRKAWPQQVQAVLNATDVKIRVERRNDEREFQWFDANESSNAAAKAYEYVMSLHAFAKDF